MLPSCKFFGLMAAVLWLGVCAHGAPPADRVVLQLKWRHQFQFAGYYAAQEKGFYREAGLDVDIREVEPGVDPVQEVVAGHAQYGVGTSALLLARQEGKPVVVLAVIFQHSPFVLVARAASGIDSIHDLAGKRVMLEPHTDELFAYLRKESLSERELRLQDHSFDPMDLVRGNVDAISAYSTDEAFFLDRVRFRYLLFSPRSAGIDFYGDNLFTSEGELRSHPKRAEAFREASLKGWKYAMQHPEEIADLLIARYGERHGKAYLLYEAKKMVPLLQPELVEMGYMNSGRWGHIADTYAELGLLPRDISLEGFLYDPEKSKRMERRRLAVALGVALSAGGLLAGLALVFLRLNRRLKGEILRGAAITSELKESEKKYRLLVECAEEWILVVQDGQIRLANPIARATSGFSETELLGQPFLAFIHPEDQALAGSLHQKLMDGDTVPAHAAFRWMMKSGAVRWLEMSAVRFDWEGRSGILSFLTDITERRRMEEETARLEGQNRMLQKAESLSRMAGAIAHHFNNQLLVVMGNLELMSAQKAPGCDQTLLGRAREAAGRASEVSRLLLTYLGQSSGERERLPLAAICQESLPILQVALPPAVSLEVDIPAAPGPVVLADKGQIQQVLAALVTNAWEALEESCGTIRIRVCTSGVLAIRQLHRFPVGWQPQDEAYACLEVEDTGPGVVESDMDKLFDPFFSTKFTGRGLGLPVALGIVRSHGGAITLACEPGQGAVFRVFLPLAPTAPQEAGEPAPLGRAKPSGAVLLVEDDELVCETAGALVESLGYHLYMAEDGARALAIFREHAQEIRCVLSDVTLPGMDGWRLLAALRQEAPGIPVVLASGYDRDSVMAGHRDEAPAAFLHKPFGLQQLREALEQALA